jgi:hypothetical protein
MVEISRNAFSHGLATQVRYNFKAFGVQTEDNGTPFSLADLVESRGRGGLAAARQVLDDYAPRLLTSYQRSGRMNEISVTKVGSADDLLATSKCAFELPRGRPSAIDVGNYVEAHPDCDTVLLVSRYGFAFSDVWNLIEKVASTHPDREIVLVSTGMSFGLEKLVTKKFPKVRLVTLKH